MQQGCRETELDSEVPVRDGIQRVVRDLAEAELRSRHLPIDGKTGSSQCC